MFTNIFDNRSKKISNVLRLCDSLARSLRKGVEVFDISESKIMFLTEDEKFITGNLDPDTVTFNILEITDGSVIRDSKLFDKFIESKVLDLVSNLLQDEYSDASTEFSSILECWEQQARYDRIRNKLDDKVTKLLSNNRITESTEFGKLVELKEGLIKFLKDNSDKVSGIDQIINSLLLSNKISEAFNFPKISYEDLNESKQYVVNGQEFLNTYDMIFRQELIKRELLESKENMDGIWASNEKFRTLAGAIFESNENDLADKIFNLTKEVPYFALASKTQISEMLSRYSSLKEGFASPREIKEYSSKIFEMKKPLKDQILSVLNEKYGINVQNLKEPPTFKTLIKAQISIFESISKLLPKSALKDVIKEFTTFYKNCQGVESVDVNEFLTEVFQESIGLNESSILNYIDLSRVADDLQKFSIVLKQVQGQAQGMGTPGGAPTPGSPMSAPPAAPAGGMVQAPGGAMPNPAGQDQQYPSDETLNPQGVANQAKSDMDASMQPGAGAPGATTGEVSPEMAEPPSMGQDQLVQQLNALDAILQDLSFELKRGQGGDGQSMGMEPEEGLPPEEGMGGEEEMMAPEEGGEEMMAPEEGGEEVIPGEEEELPPEEYEVEETEKEAPKPKAKTKKKPSK